MKYLAFAGILIVGVSIGFFIGRSSAGGGETEIVEGDPETEYVTEYVTDTVHHTETVEVIPEDIEVGIDSLLADSLLALLDSTLANGQEVDSIENDVISISREKKVAERNIELIVLTENANADTTIKNLLGIDNQVQQRIFVEFWVSPLNYNGYKLSSKKLILYGLSPQLKYRLYKRENDYYLHAQEVFYKMEETSEFLSYVQVDKAAVFND